MSGDAEFPIIGAWEIDVRHAGLPVPSFLEEERREDAPIVGSYSLPLCFDVTL
jgi:hypothetical protein